MLNYRQLFEKCRSMEVPHNVAFLCVDCGEPHPKPVLRCTKCKGAIDAFYNLDRVQIGSDVNPLHRYFDLLPIARKENAIWTGEGNTPLLEPHALRKLLNLPNLFLKDETTNPTSSTKDRMASVAVSLLKERGVKAYTVSSTGNSSTAFVRANQLIGGMDVHVFVGKEWLARLNYRDSSDVHTWAVETTFVGAADCSKDYAEHHGMHSEGGFFNLGRREGLKLAYLEAFDQMDQAPDYVFQAVSSAMGLLGGYKGAVEYQQLGRLDKMPRFFGVQQESCAPMANAWKDGCEQMPKKYIVEEPKGLAMAILRGNASQAYPYVKAMCDQSGGGLESVNDAQIIGARSLLEKVEGLDVCYASATCLAGLIKQVEAGLIDRNARILVVLTGADRPTIPAPQRVTHVSRAQVASRDYFELGSQFKEKVDA